MKFLVNSFVRPQTSHWHCIQLLLKSGQKSAEYPITTVQQRLHTKSEWEID